ncbi:hypothetical protein KPATCC21470_0411 [Kitasatospora purpeofusca]
MLITVSFVAGYVVLLPAPGAGGRGSGTSWYGWYVWPAPPPGGRHQDGTQQVVVTRKGY